MDKMIYYAGHYPRRLDLVPYISEVGFLYGKRAIVNQSFATCNFSFILNGDGWYMYNGEKLKVTAPCILLQWPDEHNYYGPDTVWDEIYFKYNSSIEEKLSCSGVYDRSCPVFVINRLDEVKQILLDMRKLFETSPTIFPSDFLDLLCWRAVSESVISPLPEAMQSKPEITVRKIAAKIKSEPLIEYNFKGLAEKHGMALPTFRRYFHRYTGTSPARFQADLRLAEACRLLVKTDLTIGQIADHINFNDPLYFSRFFRKKTGLTATQYRRNNRYTADS